MHGERAARMARARVGGREDFGRLPYFRAPSQHRMYRLSLRFVRQTTKKVAQRWSWEFRR